MSASRPSAHAPVWKLWLNPIFRRYCKSRLRPRAIGVAILIDLLIAGFIVAMVSSVGTRAHAHLEDSARSAVIPLLIFQGLILFAFGTAQVSGGMITERDEGVIDYQRLAPMSPMAKVFGYLFGLPVREYVMFIGTLPFTIWALWCGKVAMHIWLPLYLAVFSSTIVYHLTGLVTGTAVRNRRTALIVSIGLVFCLYTLIPQAAKFGLVFFKYLTIRPVFAESLPGILPEDFGIAVEAAQRVVPTVKFFNLGFSETVFTLFTQAGLILTFIVMLCRKWRSEESHLLGKLWAVVFYIWVQVLLLGNALPLIKPGLLFPSHGLSRMASIVGHWSPTASEAVLMSGLYGAVTLIFMLMLTFIITPTADHQRKGWRRARKQGDARIPALADAASSYGFVAAMALAGGIGWFLFSRGLVESKWFPGHQLEWSAAGYFAVLFVSVGLLFQAVLEANGKRVLGLLTIFIGIVPLMVGMVFGALSNELISAAIWIAGLSPLSMPFYASSSLLSIAKLPEHAMAAMPNAFHFWLALSLLAMVWRSYMLRQARKAMAQVAMQETADR